MMKGKPEACQLAIRIDKFWRFCVVPLALLLHGQCLN